MKKHCFDSLTAFYNDITNDTKSRRFPAIEKNSDKKQVGLNLTELKKYKTGYPTGVLMLSHLKDFEYKGAENVKYFSSIDGYDIDIERMYEGRNFLLDKHKRHNLPKAIDLYINVAESMYVKYKSMLQKTYAALKIVDQLESIGVRVAVYSCMTFAPIKRVYGKKKGEIDVTDARQIEVCIKDYADPVNLGALCTAISPWFLRHWCILWMHGKIPNLHGDSGVPRFFDKSGIGENSIVIETGSCLTTDGANKFIDNLNLNSNVRNYEQGANKVL